MRSRPLSTGSSRRRTARNRRPPDVADLLWRERPQDRLHLKVFHNGILKHESNTQVNQSGPSYTFYKVVGHVGWGLAVGNPLIYRGKATLTSGPYTNYWTQSDWNVIVSAPTGMAPVEDRDRRAWA